MPVARPVLTVVGICAPSASLWPLTLLIHQLCAKSMQLIEYSSHARVCYQILIARVCVGAALRKRLERHEISAYAAALRDAEQVNPAVTAADTLAHVSTQSRRWVPSNHFGNVTYIAGRVRTMPLL